MPSPYWQLNDPDWLRTESPDGDTYGSARQGTAFLIRGAMQGVRNLVSHPESPEPDEVEALEMLAVLSYVAHLVDRSSAMP